MGRWSGRVGSRWLMALVVGVLAVPAAAGAVPGPGDADLSGRVVDDANGVGVDGAVVCLWDDDGAICATTANNGRYAFDDVAGDVVYELRVVPPVGTSYLPVGGDPGTYVPVPAVPVTPVAGGVTTQDVALSKGGRFAVTVRWPDGMTPAPGQPVWVCRTDDPGGPGSCPTAVPAPATNAAGQSLTPVLLPGDYEITAGSASGPAGYPATVTEYADEDSTLPVGIRLIGGGSLAGDVVDTDGLAVVGAQVSVAVPSIGTRQATTGGDGGYSFPSLPPGTYVVTVTPPSGSDLGSSTNPAVGIVEFGEAEVDFVLGPASPPVVGYGFSGFLPPLGKENAAKAGSTIPVKWRITGPDGTPVADPTSFVALTEAPCGGGASTPIVAPLRYQGDGTWQLNWKTAKGETGCRTLALQLDDGLGGRTIDVRLR